MSERLMKIGKEDRQKIVKNLNRKYSFGEMSELTGINKSTLIDWATLRQNNTGESIHVSISLIYRKINALQPENITDWGRKSRP